MKSTIITIAGLFGLGAALENTATASQGFQEIIPASACLLEDEEDIGKADIVDGSWVIDAAVDFDDVELLCPVRIAPFFWKGLSLTELVWSHIDIFYRDPDGTSTNHSVTASLRKISRAGAAAISLDSITSNTKIATTDTRYSEPLLVFAIELDESQHFVRVVLRQGPNDGMNRVRFTRVRLFVDPPG